MNIWSHSWAVITSDREKARELMQRIENDHGASVYHRIDGVDRMLLRFSDGVSLRWLRPAESIRGYRTGKLWCDVNTDQETLNNVILPKYRGKAEDIVWFGGSDAD